MPKTLDRDETLPPEDATDAAMPPRRVRGVRGRWRAGWFALAAGAIALLTLAAREGRVTDSPSPPTLETSPVPAFVPATAREARSAVPLALTAPRFRLDEPDALEPARAEPARRNPATGRREDSIVQGGFAVIDAPYLRLTLTEMPDSEAGPGLFVTLARRAADGQGLAVIRAGERGSIRTKFGAVETLAITLGGEGTRACTGFAGLDPGPVRLDGWLCAPLGQAPEAQAVTCALDNVTVNGQAWPEGEGAFAALDAGRDPACRPRSVVERDAGSQTGSIPHRRTRKNEAKLRPSREARP